MKTLKVEVTKVLARQCVRCGLIFGWYYTCPECGSISTRDAKYAIPKGDN